MPEKEQQRYCRDCRYWLGSLCIKNPPRMIDGDTMGYLPEMPDGGLCGAHRYEGEPQGIKRWSKFDTERRWP